MKLREFLTIIAATTKTANETSIKHENVGDFLVNFVDSNSNRVLSFDGINIDLETKEFNIYLIIE